MVGHNTKNTIRQAIESHVDSITSVLERYNLEFIPDEFVIDFLPYDKLIIKLLDLQVISPHGVDIIKECGRTELVIASIFGDSMNGK